MVFCVCERLCVWMCVCEYIMHKSISGYIPHQKVIQQTMIFFWINSLLCSLTAVSPPSLQSHPLHTPSLDRWQMNSNCSVAPPCPYLLKYGSIVSFQWCLHSFSLGKCPSTDQKLAFQENLWSLSILLGSSKHSKPFKSIYDAPFLTRSLTRARVMVLWKSELHKHRRNVSGLVAGQWNCSQGPGTRNGVLKGGSGPPWIYPGLWC